MVERADDTAIVKKSAEDSFKEREKEKAKAKVKAKQKQSLGGKHAICPFSRTSLAIRLLNECVRKA